MPDYSIAAEALLKLVRGVVPLALVVFGLLVLLGQPPVQTLAGVAAGTLFALWNFWLLARSAVRAAAMGDPARGQRAVAVSYVTRYVLTAVFLAAVMLTRWVSIPGAVLPLFFPKLTLLLSNYGRKEEKHR